MKLSLELQGKVCCYCKERTEFVDSSKVYGKSYGMIYLCEPCNAWVGVHKGTDQALGRVANKKLREAKQRAHYYFDKISKTGLINKIWPEYIPNISNRNKAYLWLSKMLKIDREYCHIGMMDLQQCNRVIEVSKKHIYK